MADIYFYQVEFTEVIYMIYVIHYADLPLWPSSMKPLQQCDPEDETDGGSTLGGETNTQVLKRLTTE